MKAWLIVNHYLNSEKFSELNSLLTEAAARESIALDIKTNAEILSSLTICGGTDLDLPDFVLFWDKDITLCRMLESLGLFVFNSSNAIASCDNKGLTHAILLGAGIKMPKTIIAPLSFKKEDLSEFTARAAAQLGFPLIIKESFGSFGAQVYMAEDIVEAVDIANSISPSQMIFQEFVASSGGHDIRIHVVGGRVVASMERISEEDFRANITRGGKMKNYTPKKEEEEVALRAARALKLDFCGVDLLFGEDGPVLCEVNSNAHIKNILDCTGVNVGDHIFRYIKDKLS